METDKPTTDENADTTVDCDEPESLRKMFIGRLDFNTTEETFKKYFEKWGTIVDAVVMKDPKSKKSRGFGFVTYSMSSMVDAVQNARPHEIDGRAIETKRAVPREDVDRPDLSATVKKIYVGGLEEEHDDEALKEYFGRFGKVTSVNIVAGKGPKPRRYGFVEFDDYDPVDKIVLQKTHPIKGQLVNVKKSQPKDAENTNARKRGGNQSRFGNRNSGGGGGGGSNWGNGSVWSDGANFNGGGGYGGGGGNFGGNNWGGNQGFGFGNQGGFGGGGGGGGFGGNNFGGGMGGPMRNQRGNRGGPYGGNGGGGGGGGGGRQGMGGGNRRRRL